MLQPLYAVRHRGSSSFSLTTVCLASEPLSQSCHRDGQPDWGTLSQKPLGARGGEEPESQGEIPSHGIQHQLHEQMTRMIPGSGAPGGWRDYRGASR